MKKRSFASYKDISDVCEYLDIKYKQDNFIKTKSFSPKKYLLESLDEFYDDNSSFASETAICERIIFPIIYAPAKNNNLPVWSQLKFTVDKKRGLVGVPDFILAPPLEGAKRYKLPVVCLGEAKKNDFDQGWGQVGAEMVAAQIANKNSETPIFGLVTDGKIWEFGKLENKIFTLNKERFKTPRELDKVFNILNWMFCEARKNADQLLMLNS